MSFFERNNIENKEINSLFVEKYRPVKLAEYIGSIELKNKIRDYLKNKDIPHLLLHGKPGTGKTTLAKLITREIDCDELVINASDENGIEIIRNKVKSFASTKGFKTYKIVVLDEADFLSKNAQSMLRNLMEVHSSHCRFILTCNHLDKITEPIRSRCNEFLITPPSKPEVQSRIVNILKSERINYSSGNIESVIEAYYPDIRKTINKIQENSSEGELIINKKKLVNTDIGYRIVQILKGNYSIDDKYEKIRKELNSSKILDFRDLYTYLFDNVSDYGENKTLPVISAIADGQYKESLVADKKLQFSATIIKILEIL